MMLVSTSTTPTGSGRPNIRILAQLAVDRLAIADSGMITDVDPVMPGPRGSLISDDLMRETLLAQQMIADEKTMFPPDFQEKYGYSNVAPRMPLGATKATGATAANVVQGPPDPESAGGQPSAIVDPAADVFAISPMEQIAIDRRPDPESLAFDDLADFYNPDGSVKTTGRDIDPGPQDEDQYDSRDDVKAYQAAMRQASGGSLLDRVIGGITGGKSEAEIAAINKAYVDRPYSALGISPGLALAATGDKALAGRLGGSIAMDASGNQVPLTGDMLADLNTRATGLGKFFNNNIMNSIADGGTAVVNDGRIEGALATGVTPAIMLSIPTERMMWMAGQTRSTSL